jgi:very-short-patch-repair endonuclease
MRESPTETVRLPGCFEGCTREQWIESYGIDLRQIDRKAAETYLEGEADFFDDFDEDYGRVYDKQNTLEDRRIQFANAAVNLCQSPIEQIFLAALLWLSYGYGAWIEIWDSTMPFEPPDADVVISPQHQIGDYRVDFAILLNNVPYEQIRIVVECDGHDFHEKTKEQAIRDKKRDRKLQIAGWKVLRFSGSEIWRDHFSCGAHVDVLALKEIDAQLRLSDQLFGPRR